MGQPAPLFAPVTHNLEQMPTAHYARRRCQADGLRENVARDGHVAAQPGIAWACRSGLQVGVWMAWCVWQCGSWHVVGPLSNVSFIWGFWGLRTGAKCAHGQEPGVVCGPNGGGGSVCTILGGVDGLRSHGMMMVCVPRLGYWAGLQEGRLCC